MSKKKPKTILPVREPNGRLSRSMEALLEARAPNEVKRLRDAAARKMAAPEWGTELGRLYLEGKIGPILYETGKRLGKLAELYAQATGAPVDASPSMLFAARRLKRAADPDSEEGRAQAECEEEIMLAMNDAIVILHAIGKPRLVNLVLRVCQRGEACGLDSEVRDLQLGLAWVANHWGLLGLDKKQRVTTNVRSPV